MAKDDAASTVEFLHNRREMLRLLALAPVAAACAPDAKPASAVAAASDTGNGTPDSTTTDNSTADLSTADASAEVAPAPCTKVGANAAISHGPISGGSTATSVRLAVRLSGPAKVQFRLQAKGGGAPIDSECGLAQESDDFSVVVQAIGLVAATEYAVTPIIDDAAIPERAIYTRTFSPAGTSTEFSFVFGSCCRYDDLGTASTTMGKTFELVEKLPEKPWFFAQAGDWTYPDYAFVKQVGKDAAGNNYTVFPAEIAKAWRRKLTDKYPIRKVLAAMPLAHIWDDHDFAENNSHKAVTGSQSARMAAFRRYLPTFDLPGGDLGAWQRFSVGHCDFFLVDMRSQRTDVKAAILKEKQADGTFKYSLKEPAGHTMLGQTQLNWLMDGLKTSKALWKIVILPVEINPRYDVLMQESLKLGISLLIEAIGDSWSGYPSERKQLLDLHTSGAVKNMVFLTGDAHMGAMAQRDASCPPIFMSANLDIDQAPIMDFLVQFNIDPKPIWPQWFQDSTGENTIGRVRVVTAPGHQLVFEAWGHSGQVLHSMTIEAQA